MVTQNCFSVSPKGKHIPLISDHKALYEPAGYRMQCCVATYLPEVEPVGPLPVVLVGPCVQILYVGHMALALQVLQRHLGHCKGTQTLMYMQGLGGRRDPHRPRRACTPVREVLNVMQS